MYRDLLRRVEDRARSYGDALQAPCDERRLEKLRGRVGEELGTVLPEDYADFLRLTDGMNWNGLYLYPSETFPIAGHPEYELRGLVEPNLDYREDDWFADLLVFGDDGLDLYARRISTGEYQIYDRVPNNLIETVPSFDALASAALGRCLS